MKSKNKLLIYAGICALLFIILTLISKSSFVWRIDNFVSNNIVFMQNSFLNAFFMFVDFIFESYFVILFVIIVYFILHYNGKKKEAVVFLFAMILCEILVFIMKNVVARARPALALLSNADYSFPSGHVASAIVFFGFLIYFSLKYAKEEKRKIYVILSIITIIIISFSRIYLNVHWMSDVIGSLFLGLFVLFFCIWVLERKVLGKMVRKADKNIVNE